LAMAGVSEIVKRFKLEVPSYAVDDLKFLDTINEHGEVTLPGLGVCHVERIDIVAPYREAPPFTWKGTILLSCQQGYAVYNTTPELAAALAMYLKKPLVHTPIGENMSGEEFLTKYLELKKVKV